MQVLRYRYTPALVVSAFLLATCATQSSIKPASALSEQPDHSSATAQPQSQADAAVAVSDNPIPPSVLLAGLPVRDIALIQAEAKRVFAKHWPVVSERSRFVRTRIHDVLADMDMPEGLLVLPVVESGYNPYALSSAGAMGLWQLMPGTARILGIKERRYIDGRRHVSRSTKAAFDYLSRLKQRFHYWPLALAAYHRGPAAVARLLRKKAWKPEDGLHALPVPRITRTYVRHVLGLAALYHMGVFEFPAPIPTQPLKIEAPVDLKRLAKASGMDSRTLFRMNPGLEYSQYLSSSVHVHVPAAEYDLFSQQLPAALPELIRIHVRRGDSLWKLARKYGTSVKFLRNINPGVHTHLRAGQTLQVPARKFARARPAPNPLLSQGRRIRYRVRSGDNLWNIAKKFGTSPVAIARANRLDDPSRLRPGDTLWILARIRPS